ncbi:hypothetical protein [Rhodococcus sp. IEGM 1318]|uniref:hypothetical protein n=1 Tax=Rhodococcus sp. IEGM 1318 TaxID=3082226 RepID=UPI002953BA69|nr:hypothetical protein [Rhodococcus sp. IEGM 1318]MDV8009470.1 hypothetical protein [Rhodococcus sp. IEGM 1318]
MNIPHLDGGAPLSFAGVLAGVQQFFTQHNLDSGETWWSTDMTPHVRAFGLDTCNAVAGADGAVPEDQFDWLRKQLAQAQTQAQKKLVLIGTVRTTV